jgi:hypothetical protein
MYLNLLCIKQTANEDVDSSRNGNLSFLLLSMKLMVIAFSCLWVSHPCVVGNIIEFLTVYVYIQSQSWTATAL